MTFFNSIETKYKMIVKYIYIYGGVIVSHVKVENKVLVSLKEKYYVEKKNHDIN